MTQIAATRRHRCHGYFDAQSASLPIEALRAIRNQKSVFICAIFGPLFFFLPLRQIQVFFRAYTGRNRVNFWRQSLFWNPKARKGLRTLFGVFGLTIFPVRRKSFVMVAISGR